MLTHEKTRLSTCASLIVRISIIAVSMGFPAKAKECQSLHQLKWMLGTWVSNTGKVKVIETWWQVSDNTFEGEGISISENKTTKETLRIVQMSDHIFYLAKVESNAMPVPFKLTSCASRQAVFSNPEHDFPTRLRYTLNHTSAKKDEMYAHVSGADGKGFTIAFKKQLSQTH